VIKAVAGDEGVAMAESHKPDLILMDVMLPGLDGYEATRRIKDTAALRHIPVIAVPAYALDGEESRAEDAGCDAYFSKPVSPRTLLAKVREYIG
jgi:two-component system cell cycle response regulator DivK